MNSKEQLKAIAKGESLYIPERFIHNNIVFENSSPGLAFGAMFKFAMESKDQENRKGLATITKIPKGVKVIFCVKASTTIKRNEKAN